MPRVQHVYVRNAVLIVAFPVVDEAQPRRAVELAQVHLGAWEVKKRVVVVVGGGVSEWACTCVCVCAIESARGKNP